ncbi:dihydrofolate reductase [Galendromus occidentalis]|uniref:dihydrofolate reductase n=1 Tax=Galendromus occidentalis TaxID=34638 RepID=A0AAJ7SIH1_9ACAR|nr:dihydrofolate reductase [Galendromus occidentalis]
MDCFGIPAPVGSYFEGSIIVWKSKKIVFTELPVRSISEVSHSALEVMIPLCAVVAACKASRGIGFRGDLPWGRKLPNEMKHFARVTTETKEAGKLNSVVMGRKTWESIPDKRRPLPNRVNIIVSATLQPSDQANGVFVVRSLEEALEVSRKENVERVMVIGGAQLYQDALKHPDLSTVYLTDINTDFECDTFLEIDERQFQEEDSIDPAFPRDIQEENGIQYRYRVLRKL